MSLLCVLLVPCLLGGVGGCAAVPKSPTVIRHVAAADLSQPHPACLQARTARAPKAFVVKDEQSWKQVWGQGEDPPVVNFETQMVFGAFTSLSSEGPGTMEVWVLKYREAEDVLEVRVKERVSGSYPLSAGYSRAYEFVKLPRSDKPIKVLWRYQWGERDEESELQAHEWAPEAVATPTSGAQQNWGGPVN